jgi:large subunit ribosomal protein L17
MTATHRQAVLSGMVRSLFQAGKITTTVARAKAASRFAEKMITLAKKNTLATRRAAQGFLNCDRTVKKLFAEIRTKNEKRVGGYTRVIRSGFRTGDGAPMAILELVEKIAIDVKETPKTIKEKIDAFKKKQDAAKTEKKGAAGKK